MVMCEAVLTIQARVISAAQGVNLAVSLIRFADNHRGVLDRRITKRAQDSQTGHGRSNL